MRYAPYSEEYASFSQLNESQQLEYFLTRIFETEEVWGLDDGTEWVFREQANGGQTLPLWPYEKFAQDAATGPWQDKQPQAESMEDFIYHTLEMLIEEDVMVEIMPNPQQPGGLISPHQLLSILTGMIDAGEYRLDG